MARYWYPPTGLEWVHSVWELNKSMEEIQETGQLPTEEKCKEIYKNLLYMESHLKLVHKEMLKLPPYKKVVEEIEQNL